VVGFARRNVFVTVLRVDCWAEASSPLHSCLMKVLESVDLLIVDERSYVTFTRSQSGLLLCALSARNDKESVR